MIFIFIYIINCKHVSVKASIEGCVEMNHFLFVMIWSLVFSGFVQCVFRMNRLHIRCHRADVWISPEAELDVTKVIVTTHVRVYCNTLTHVWHNIYDRLHPAQVDYSKINPNLVSRLPSSDDSLPEHNTTTHYEHWSVILLYFLLFDLIYFSLLFFLSAFFLLVKMGFILMSWAPILISHHSRCGHFLVYYTTLAAYSHSSCKLDIWTTWPWQYGDNEISLMTLSQRFYRQRYRLPAHNSRGNRGFLFQKLYKIQKL